MAHLDYFIGNDSDGNPLYSDVIAHGDAKGEVREDSAANMYDWNKMNFQNAFNAAEALKAREWNSAESLVKRLIAAGLNPMFFANQLSGVSNALASAGSGGQGSTGNMSSSNGHLGLVLEASKNAADSLLATQLQAQLYDIAKRLLNIEDRRTRIEEFLAGGRDRVNQTQADKNSSDVAVNTKNIELMDARIELIGVLNNWTRELINNAKALYAVLLKQLDVMDSLIKLNKDSATNQRAQANKANTEAWSIKLMTPAQVDKLRAETDLTDKQIFTEMEKMHNFMVDSQKKEVEIEVAKGLKIVLEKTADGLLIKNDFDQRYEGWERVAGIASTWFHIYNETTVANSTNLKNTVGAITDAATLGLGKAAVPYMNP